MKDLVNAKLLVKMVLVLGLACSVANAGFVHGNGNVTLIEGSEYFAISQVSDGDAGTGWVTDAPGGWPSDYFEHGTAVFVIDLGSDIAIDAIGINGYHWDATATGSHPNTVTRLSLRFATEADGAANLGTTVAYNPTLDIEAAGAGVQVVTDFSEIVTARYVEVTALDNLFDIADPSNGGDRVGLNEVQFNEVPEPATMALLGLGGLALLRRKNA